MDFRTDSLVSLARLVRDGDVSARELVGHALDRIEALDPALNAFVVVDADRALAEAARLDERQAAGEEVGALAGIPFAVKDLEDVAGLPTSNGSSVVTGADEAETDSVLVARLKLAGAIVVGKTNTPEHGWTAQTFNARFGTTRNPWDPDRTPGGSSGGSAAAVAAGMVPLATGSDGGGSLRIPSALCGLAGFKPSPGRVPTGGAHPPGWPLLSTKGTMGWNVPDLAASLDVVLGPDPTELRSLPTPEVSWRHAIDDPGVPIRVVWSPTLGYATVDREVLELCRRGVDALADLGAEVIEQDVVFDEDPLVPWIKLVGGYLQRTFAGVRHTDAWQQVTPGLREQVEGSEGTDRRRFREGRRRRPHAQPAPGRTCSPTAGCSSPRPSPVRRRCAGSWARLTGRRSENWVGFTYPFNMTGSPAGTICVGRTRAGLPVGLQLIGPQHGDVGVLRAMAALEQAIGFDRPSRHPGAAGLTGAPAATGRPAGRAHPGPGGCRVSGSATGKQLLEQLHVLGDHPLHREVAFDGLPGTTQRSISSRWPMASAIVDSSSTRKPVSPDSMISGAAPSRKETHRRPAREGLDHHQPEGLVPADGIDQGDGIGQQGQLLLVRHLAQVLDVGVEVAASPRRRSTRAPRVRASWPPSAAARRPCGRLRWPGGLPSRGPCVRGRGSSRRRPPPTGNVVGVDPVVDHPGDGDRAATPLGVGDAITGDPLGDGGRGR